MEENACLICGKELAYSDSAKEMKCEICGQIKQSNASCANNHFVCDNCHTNPSKSAIMNFCLNSESKDPFEIATNVMQSPFLHMHGPEHHVLVGSALLTAYKNSGGNIDLEKSLKEMEIRGSKVPGGFCGFAGACGAGISAGMFFSIITETTPMSKGTWGKANKMTSACLSSIGDFDGPRCCKRDTYLALKTACEFTEKETGIAMQIPEKIVCNFSDKNTQCLKEQCFFNPKL